MKKLACMLALLLTLTIALSACGTNEVVVSVNGDGYVVVNGNVTDIVADKDDVISVDGDGYVIVNGVKTGYKIHIKDEITVNGDGYVVVNGNVTDIVADKDDVISVDDDGYVVVNGVKTQYEVKNKDHHFGDWKLYNEDETDCEKMLYYRVCSDCSEIQWKEGTYADHDWVTVTTQPTCQAGGYDTNTCSICGKEEIVNSTPVGSHHYPETYSFDHGYHWMQCQTCGHIQDKAEHTADGDGACAVCGQLVGATEGVVYELSADGTYALVIDYTGTAIRVKIAEEYEGRPVKVIYQNAFEQKNIVSVLIPDSVTEIGDYAFSYCTSLTSIVIPDSVTTMGACVLYGCSNLKSVTMGNSVTAIGDYAFSWCTGLTSIVIPDSVTSIGARAFYECYSLMSVTMGNGITTIGDYAFEYCKSLTSIVIPDSIQTVGVNPFSNCGNLQYAEYGNCKYLGNAENPYLVLVTAVNNNYSTYTIHEQTKVIANYAFSQCERMTSITIPDSVTTIGERAFSYCSSLTSVTMGDSVTAIGEYAFAGCSSLTSVTMGDSVTTIGERAFYDCSSLTSIVIPDSVTTIGGYTFYYCSSLIEIQYHGSKAQWEAIKKEDCWDLFTPQYTIHCTDGDLTK